jgi:hypothetical protein
MDALADTALAEAETRLGDVLGRNADPLARIEIADAALGNGFGHRLADLAPIAGKKALPVDGTLFLAVVAAINDAKHQPSLRRCSARPERPDARSRVTVR